MKHHDTNVYHPVCPTTHPYLSEALQAEADLEEWFAEAEDARASFDEELRNAGARL